MDDIDTARYISLTTFTKDGRPKATPVWISGDGGTYLFYTGLDAWKTKRLRNDPRVEVRACDMRGKVDPHAAVHTGTAEVLDDQASIDEAKRSIADKYGWQAALARFADGVRNRLGRGDEPVAIRISLDA
jgi:PPOX class probable F420-dependent enzyme